jgi:hypothetical protein
MQEISIHGMACLSQTSDEAGAACEMFVVNK